MQNNISTSKAKRSIYSNFIFPTDNHDKRTHSKTGDFKSISAGCFLDRASGFTKELNEKSTALEKCQDSSTQTSKTILQLAQIESGSISPDSSNESPKVRTKILRNTDTQTSVEALESSEGYVSCDNDKVFEYVDGRSSLPPPNSANTDADVFKVEQELEATNTLFFKANAHFPADLNKQQSSSLRQNLIRERCSTPFVETFHPNYVQDQEDEISCSDTPSNLSDRMEANGKNTNSSSVSSSPRSSTRGKITYMAPTISSENKNAQNVIKQLNQSFNSPKRGRSASPNCKGSQDGKSIPFMERSGSTVSYDAFKSQKKTLSSSKSTSYQKRTSTNCSSVDLFYNKETIRKEPEDNASISCDIMSTPLAKIKDPDWNTCIQGLAEIIDCCRMADVELIYPHMTTINQKLIESSRSPRSHVCRTACQAAGHSFEFVRDTRRPEFDEVVDLSSFKTADANKFIRQDANLALDCMVTHIPTSHAIRASCSKGPSHKNYLVRTATVRLVVCAVVIAGSESILSPNSSEQTRKRIFCLSPKFVEDKNLEVRRFGERLFKVLSKEFRFDLYLKKYSDKEEILNMRKNIRNISFKS